MQFVVDPSVTLAWCFEDEATTWTDGLLDRLRNGDQIVVPAHWPTEVSNGMLMALRRKRIQPDRPVLFWDELAVLPIEVESPLPPSRAKAVLALGLQHGLTVYDAAYLELAQRKGIPPATLDSALLKVAPLETVKLIARTELAAGGNAEDH
jgi:predicted nucleic acid-binding protein